LPFRLDEPATDVAIVLHPSPLLDVCVALFEKVWADAGAVPGRAPVQRLTPAAQQLLTLLAAGGKDTAIARQLNTTPRTIQRRVAVLMRKLGAQSRFQAGAIASQRGWLGEPKTAEADRPPGQ
jgi:DNA-binding CsgD family transcriptional regulator